MTNYNIPIYRVSLVKQSEISLPTPISDPKDIAKLCKTFLGDTDREHVLVVLLDGAHQVIGINTVSIGSLNSSIVHPREVFKPAILANALAIVVAHNHPSGNVTPSQEDHAVTKQLKEAGLLLSIPLLDHVIIGHADIYYSFQEQGVI